MRVLEAHILEVILPLQILDVLLNVFDSVTFRVRHLKVDDVGVVRGRLRHVEVVDDGTGRGKL